jgi:hypothetical protein
MLLDHSGDLDDLDFFERIVRRNVELKCALIKNDPKELYYRTPSRACYSTRSGGRTCYDTVDADPLFDAELPKVAERLEQSEFFELVAHANLQAIALDRILPPHERAAHDRDVAP